MLLCILEPALLFLNRLKLLELVGRGAFECLVRDLW